MTNHAYCLGQSGLAVFAATADQRYLLGPDIFMRTHFPITLRRFRDGRDPELVNEDDLLARLLTSVPASQGNRVFVLYGAAGSGKSELMRWLQTRLEQESPARAEAMVRVARTDLDALAVTEKFRRLLGGDYFDEATRRRWQMARRKPRTLAKLIALGALESLLDDDETINALFYRLTNVIQPHMAHCLGAADAPGVVDILSRETWEEVVAETVLPVPVDYEALRHQMLVALQAHLLEGLNLPRTLRLISEHVVAAHKSRPILLVDDLVQSLNLFATDMLDYFVTLESGQWDVVLGLTPAAFENGQRGRELLQRIAYLDTLDDRVTKLWLSDDAGSESYFLTEENCARFAVRYLVEHRRLNAQAIGPTDGAGSCLTFNGDASLCPFNHEALLRLFRGLPRGKGKARYFLHALREVLGQAGQGVPLTVALDGLAKREMAARCDDSHLAWVAELYGPLVTDSGPVMLSADLLRFFGLEGASRTIEMEALTRQTAVHSAVREIVDDEEKAAIHDWLQGKPVNRQLLKGLRRGTARWLRAVAAPDLLYRDGISRPHGVLRWKQTYLNTSPPIRLVGVDEEGQGISLGREIGPVAFDLHRFATATGAESKRLLTQLAAETCLLPTLLAASEARHQSIARLEAQLGMSIETLALQLYVVLCLHAKSLLEHLPGFNAEFRAQLESVAICPVPGTPLLGSKEDLPLRRLFEDWFKLRENVYYGAQIDQLVAGRSPDALLAPLNEVDAAGVDREYRLGNTPLGEVLVQIRDRLRQWEKMADPEKSLSPPAQATLDTLERGDSVPLSRVPNVVWAELQAACPVVYAALWVAVEQGTRLRCQT